MTAQHDSQQLTLLPAPDVPVQFRLDEATRRRGLRHVAEIRQQLAARQAARAVATIRAGEHTDATRRTAA
jgi:hypothetical protein